MATRWNKSTDVHFLFFNPLQSRRQDVFRRTLGAGNGVVVRRNPRNPHYDTEMQIKILVECWRAGEGLGQEFVKHSMREHTSRRVGSHRKDRVLRFQRKFSHIGDEDRESHGHLQNNVGGTRRRGRKSARGRDAQSGRRQGSGPTLR